MPPSRPPNFQRRGKGKRRRRNLGVNSAGNRQKAPVETAPHILAALQAQRERAARRNVNNASREVKQADEDTPTRSTEQQHPQQPARLPGFVFDKERDRFFRLAKKGAGHPAQAAATARPATAYASRKQGDARVLATDTTKAGLDRTNKLGLHAYVMNRRTGSLGGLARYQELAGGGGWRRAAVESVARSSRFQAKQTTRFVCEKDVAVLAYHPEREAVAFGSTSGCVSVFGPRRPLPAHSNKRPRMRWADDSLDLVRWTQETGAGKVSDVTFAEYEAGLCYAFAWLGDAGRPGQVKAHFACSASDGFDVTQSVRLQLGQGSAWCAEFDPCSPDRLVIGTSTVCPVSMYDLQSSQLSPIAQVPSDVFSVAFLPRDAPGAGSAIMALGLRNGSVRLLDPRLPWPSGRSTDVLARMDSSVDHVQVLRDGRRCLVRDQSGGLQTHDLRAPRRGPVRVLVPSKPGRMRPFCRGKFALDPSETVVASPIGRRVGGEISPGRGGVGEAEIPASPGRGSGDSPASCPRHHGVRSLPDGEGSQRGGERLRILSVATGEILSDVVTPWSGLSLARGATRAGDGGYPLGDFSFRGIGLDSGDGGGSRVFDARLWPEGEFVAETR